MFLSLMFKHESALKNKTKTAPMYNITLGTAAI